MEPKEILEYLFNSCEVIDGRYYYNESYIRECKINTLLNKEKPEINKQNSTVLFAVDRYYFYYCYDNIYMLFRDNFDISYGDMHEMVRCILNTQDNLKGLEPCVVSIL